MRYHNIISTIVRLMVFLSLFSCSFGSSDSSLRKEAESYSEIIRRVWTLQQQQDNLLFVSADSSPQIPHMLQGFVTNPTTTFDYLYVRSWPGEQGGPIRRFLAYFVIRNISTGAMVRVSVQDGLTRIESLPPNFWSQS